MKISVIIICYNRKGELSQCITSLLKQDPQADEILVIDNASSDGTEDLFADGRYPSIQYIKLDENLGVAGGRNYGIERAIGDVLFFIDDDALLEKPGNAFELVAERFERDKNLGIVSFKIVNYHSRTMQREEFPHRDKSLDPDREFETTYYIGCGHAIRRELFEACGPYPDDYFYGFEELDLSFRAIDKGNRIIYLPDVVVLHMKTTRGRMGDDQQWIYSYRNRLAVSYKYLKNVHLLFLMFVWFVKIAKLSSTVSVPVIGIRRFMAYRKHLERTPVSNETLKKIRRLKGRIWY